MEKYEIAPAFFKDRWLESMVSTLTGLPLEEILPVTSDVGRSIGGQRFIRVFRDLGFNANPRWIKFDPLTEYPCIIRVKTRNSNGWYAFGYYDFKLYTFYDDSTWTEKFTYRFMNGKYYLVDGDGILKITSMLQVWI